MFLLAAIQAHLSKIMLKITEIETFCGALEEKDRYCLFLEDIQLKGTYLLFAIRKFFALEYLGSMGLQFDF